MTDENCRRGTTAENSRERRRFQMEFELVQGIRRRPLVCVCALSGGNKNARSLHSPAPKCATQQPPSLSFISQINTHQFNTRQPPVAEVRAETAAEMNIFFDGMK